MRRKLMGDEYAERINRTVYDDPMMQKFIDVASENVFGRCGHVLDSISRRAP